jgi:hypothetical protein
LIAQGEVDVNAVVTADVQRQVRAAIAQVGLVGYLAPIKVLLPEDFDYGVIRCAVEAWKIEQAPRITKMMPSAEAVQPTSAFLVDLPCEPLRRWRHQRAIELNHPDWVLFGDGTLRQAGAEAASHKLNCAAFQG